MGAMDAALALQWPWSLGASPQISRFCDNISGLAETFESCSKNLFTLADSFELEACHADSSGCRAEKIKTLKALQLYLEEINQNSLTSNKGPSFTSRLFFIHQRHTRAELEISREAMMFILDHVKVFPLFVNILTQFELRTKEAYTSTKSMSPLHCRNWQKDDGNPIFETAYTLQYAEKNNRPGLGWSIRKMAVYQRFSTVTSNAYILLIQTSDQVQKRILELSKNGGLGELSSHWTILHEVYLGTLGHNWGIFLHSINVEVGSTDLYYFTNAQGLESVRPTFENIKALHHWIDILTEMSHSLQTNIDVLHSLAEESHRRATLDGSVKNDIQYSHFQDILRMAIAEQAFLRQQTEHIRGFTDRRAGQLRDAIALQDSNAMMALNHKTIQETQTMRIITLVALIYLPASFTASFFGMGYVNVGKIDGNVHITGSDNLWFYFAITAPLMVITLGIWWLWEWILKRRARKKIDDKEEFEKSKDV